MTIITIVLPQQLREGLWVWVAQEPIFYTINAKTYQGLGPKRRESCDGDRVYLHKIEYSTANVSTYTPIIYNYICIHILLHTVIYYYTLLLLLLLLLFILLFLVLVIVIVIVI